MAAYWAGSDGPGGDSGGPGGGSSGPGGGSGVLLPGVRHVRKVRKDFRSL